MNIFFVRHGQTEWNELGKFQGSKDSPLTKIGILQAEKLGARLAKENFVFDKIYSSPMGRAFSTAKIITQNQAIIETIDEFKEISVGEMEGIPFTEFENLFPTEYYNFFNNPVNYVPTAIKGESFSSLMARVQLGLKKITDLNKTDSNILIVTHGITLKAILSVIKNRSTSLELFAKEEIPGNTSFTHIEYDNGNFSIIDFSNTDHLK